MEKFIKIAADDIKSLRKADVFRVLEQNDVSIRQQIAEYISKEREDLADEVYECLEDL